MAITTIEDLVGQAAGNTEWRRRETFNLIPSEQTPSELVSLLSIQDPVGRYAEHKRSDALGRDIFYYQGTDFIAQVEATVQEFFRQYFNCSQAEVRLISGQMANMVFLGH